MRVLHIITAFGFGGSEQVALDLSIEQGRQGIDAHVAALRRPEGSGEVFEGRVRTLSWSNVTFHHIGGRDFRWGVPAIALRLQKLVDRLKPDILHIHGDPAEFVTAFALTARKLNVVRTIHNTQIWPTRRRFARMAEERLAGASVVAVSSDALAAFDEHRRSLGLAQGLRRAVIRNGIPLPAGISTAPTEIRFGFFGRWTPQKGIDILLDAARHLSRSNLRPRIDIYSDVPANDADSLRSEFTGANLVLKSPTPEARQLMANYSAIIVPSRFEGFGLVAIEALSLGVPVIATNAQGLREVMPPAWPLTFPVEDATALASIMRNVAEKRIDLAPLRELARAHALTFGIERAARDYVQEYNVLFERKRKAA